MERLTKRGVCVQGVEKVGCTHFDSFICCELSGQCSDGCPYEEQAWERLADYEDTGLMPEEIQKTIADATLAYNALMILQDQDANNTSICRDALATWGAEAQTLMVFEEMSELQKELCKHARGRDNREEIAEEIADVRIMLHQMCILHDCEDLADEIMREKLERLADRVKKARGEADD